MSKFKTKIEESVMRVEKKTTNRIIKPVKVFGLSHVNGTHYF